MKTEYADARTSVVAPSPPPTAEISFSEFDCFCGGGFLVSWLYGFASFIDRSIFHYSDSCHATLHMPTLAPLAKPSQVSLCEM